MAFDWHERLAGEPAAPAGFWRQRNRRSVIAISSMSDRHLEHCLRFARTKDPHRSKLPDLLAETERRGEQKKAAGGIVYC